MAHRLGEQRTGSASTGYAQKALSRAKERQAACAESKRLQDEERFDNVKQID